MKLKIPSKIPQTPCISFEIISLLNWANCIIILFQNDLLLFVVIIYQITDRISPITWYRDAPYILHDEYIVPWMKNRIKYVNEAYNRILILYESKFLGYF